MAESVNLNPLQVLNVQTGQLDKTQIMVSNGKITKIGSNLNKNFTILFISHDKNLSKYFENKYELKNKQITLIKD